MHSSWESAGREALAQMTPAATIGDLLSSEQSDNIATLRFSSHMPGYAGWDWVVSLAVDGELSTILETELVAGAEAVIAPDWVPWADRLREYEESLAAGNEDEVVIIVDEDELDEDELDDEDEIEDDDDDDDSDDFDDDVDSIDNARMTDVFDGVDDAAHAEEENDEYVVIEDKN